MTFRFLDPQPRAGPDGVRRREVELHFTTNRPVPYVARGLELAEFIFEQAMLDRNDPEENLRWMDIQAMLTRSVLETNRLNPGLHAPIPVPDVPPAPITPPPPPIREPEDDVPPSTPLHRGRRLDV